MDGHSFGAGTPTSGDQPPAKPDWYPDPQQPGVYRYWDGRQWTGHTATPPPTGQPPPGTWPSATTAAQTDGFAIASLVLGIIGGSLLAVIFGFVARRRIKRSAGARKGQGLATAGIVLGCLWMALLAVGITLALTGALEEKNTDRYGTGEEGEIAALVDRLEQALDDKDVDLACNTLLTAELKASLDAGDGCAEVVRSEGFQANLKIKRLEVDGDTARAIVSELGEGLIMTFRKIDGTWRVDGISS